MLKSNECKVAAEAGDGKMEHNHFYAFLSVMSARLYLMLSFPVNYFLLSLLLHSIIAYAFVLPLDLIAEWTQMMSRSWTDH